MVRLGKYKHKKFAALPQDNTKEVSKNAWNDDHNELGMTGHGVVTTRTISSGAMTPIHDMHIVAGEGASNDELVTMGNSESEEFDEVQLFGGSQVITVKNSGNIVTLSGLDLILSSTVATRFIRKDTTWYETGSSGGSSTTLGLFGDGSDGDVTISTNTVLTETKFYNNLTINAGVTLSASTDKIVIYVKDTLTNNGTISMNGKSTFSPGTVGALGGFTGGSGVVGLPSTIGPDAINLNIASPAPPSGGGTGGAGSTNLAVPGGNGNNLAGGGGGKTSTTGNGGFGGNGGSQIASGAAATLLAALHSIIKFISNIVSVVGASGGGGTGGSGGGAGGFQTGTAGARGTAGSAGTTSGANGGTGGTGGAPVNDGGAGGGGGGGGGAGGASGVSILIFARRIFNNASGIISSNGDDGGDGGNGGIGGSGLGQAASGGGGGGGGGNPGVGGNGGFIMLFYSIFQNNGALTVTPGTGGAGATGGVGGQGNTGDNDGGNGGNTTTANNGNAGLVIEFPSS